MTEPSQSHTPRKGSRQGKSSSGSENPQSTRRGGRRGGRAGSNAAPKYSQATEASQSQNANGALDDNGCFVAVVGTPQHLQRARPKRNAVPIEAPHAIATAINESSITHSPFISTPPKQYYAGPAFHQSPAASALPMPRFLSKSVPKAGISAPSLLEHAENAASGASSSSSTTPESSPSISQTRPNLTPQARQLDSPLDKLFQAARAEKAKQNSAVARHHNGSPVSAPANSAPVASNHWASIYGNRPNHLRTASSDSSKGLFAMHADSSSQHLSHSPANGVVAGPLALYRTVSDGTQHIQQNNHGNHVYTAPDTTHTAHPSLKPSLHNADLTNSQPPIQHYTSPHHATNPRIMHITPENSTLNTDMQSDSFHYGNKNLSPMFQAARTSSPRSQSSLRHQLDPGKAPYTKQPLPEHRGDMVSDQTNFGATMRHSAMATNVASHRADSGIDGRHERTPQGQSYALHVHNQPSGKPLHSAKESEKMQTLTDNLRNMLKIPKA